MCVVVCVATYGAVCCNVLQCIALRRRCQQSIASVNACCIVCCSVLQRVAVRCSVMQRVAVCCSILQCLCMCVHMLAFVQA